jgi:hypothetical protein
VMNISPYRDAASPRNFSLSDFRFTFRIVVHGGWAA